MIVQDESSQQATALQIDSYEEQQLLGTKANGTCTTGWLTRA